MTDTEHAAIEAALTAWFGGFPRNFPTMEREKLYHDMQRAVATYLAAGGGRAALPAEPAPGLVRVRLPVHVGRNGRTVGHFVCQNGKCADWATPQHGERTSFITADVPLPSAPDEIVGMVET